MAMLIMQIVNALVAPAESFGGFDEPPRWVPAFGMLSGISILVAVYTVPLFQQCIAVSLAGKLTEEQIAGALDLSERCLFLGAILSPIALLVKWLLMATLLCFFSFLLKPIDLKFKPFYSLLVYAETIPVLMSVVNLLLLYVKGSSEIQNVTDMQAVVGLDVFLQNRSSNLPLFTLLNSINVFTVWYVATVTIGVSAITQISRLSAGILVTAVWTFGVLSQAALTTVASRFQSLFAS